MEDTSNPDIGQIMQIFIAQMDSAMEVSKVVSEHSGEKELSADSVITGLVYRLMTPMSQDEVNEYMEKADEILNGESEEEDEDMTEDMEEEIIVDKEPRKVKHPVCNCDICMKSRICLLNYHSYETYEPLSTMFNDAIKKSCMESKIYI
uniref:Uncharacterized protein n=1 Tax=viral metagenome TaxID=1070528 RepID=A0A6C0F958_9ZZZZ|tara:strand:- start:1256 stop:1702 length:447 start_codon:yes stop_codon:yes gene_type:complete